MSKTDFTIKRISKQEAAPLLKQFHYLTNESRSFKSGWNWGCFKEDKLVGVLIFTGLPVPELVKGMFGLERTNQEGFFELSRLCLDPIIQQQEHNLASWFLSRCIKLLRKETTVKAILSYADSNHHNGVVYAASNFEYYGLTGPKPDFWIKQEDGTYIKHNRGKTKGIEGEWRPRTRKHRFLMVFDKTLTVLWKKETWVSKKQVSMNEVNRTLDKKTTTDAPQNVLGNFFTFS